MKQRAIFFDRDGTLIVDKFYLNDPEQLEFLPGAIEALRLARTLGFLSFVVSNQSGIARGIATEEQVLGVNQRMTALLEKEAVKLEGVEYCPHHPDFDKACDCRKPGRGMIDRFLKKHEIDLERSYVIGDSKVDIDLGLNVGATSILVLTGYGLEQRELFGEGTPPAHIADDVLAAVKWIAANE